MNLSSVPIALIILLGGLIRSVPAQSLPETLPPISPQIQRALHPNASQDFFRQGAAQFEREIERLRSGRLAEPSNLLRLREDLSGGYNLGEEKGFPTDGILPPQFSR